jgi:hypothetical protein
MPIEYQRTGGRDNYPLERMMLLPHVQEIWILLEEPFMKQRGAEYKQIAEEQMLQIRLHGLMWRKGGQQLVEHLRKEMLRWQEAHNARKWRG